MKKVKKNKCLICKKPATNKFCSNKCVGIFNTGENNPAKREDVRKKISKNLIGKNKGRIPWNKGVSRSIETINKIKKKLKGFKHTKETKEKMSINSGYRYTSIGKKRDPQIFKRISETKRKRRYEYHKHHIDNNNTNNKKENILKVTNDFHNRIHNSAYKYIIEHRLLEKYFDWFKEKFKVKFDVDNDGYKRLINKKFITVCVSGYFDPVHNGHTRLFNNAKNIGNKLIVILNNDHQAKLKKGYSFMNQIKRKEVLKSFRDVDEVIISYDKDETVCKTLKKIKPTIFANGGDRKADNIPEYKLCEELGIEMKFNIGKGGKIASSSEMVEKSKKHEKRS